MSQVELSSNGEFEMAIAAAAYAIASMNEESFMNKKSPLEGMKTSDISKSKREGNTSTRVYSRGPLRWFSNKEAKDDSKSAGDNITRKSSISDQRMQNDSTLNRKSTEKTTGSKKFGSGNEARLGPKAQSTIKPTTSSSSIKKKEGNSARSNKLDTEADAWEKAEMAKMKTRYEKMKAQIFGWETEKKTKAKRRLEQKERETEQKRAKALQEYHNEISRIDKISAEEKALVDERERNEGHKIREMAKQMRTTGRISHACLCF
ncbi:uncharacterized protein [Elaeis guineensis]|uniref:uncharacterized protein isoform X1 n=1 Tax=Elaeis guineensis var. tenera TaxID=51953 RepID=UPI003C6D96D8